MTKHLKIVVCRTAYVTGLIVATFFGGVLSQTTLGAMSIQFQDPSCGNSGIEGVRASVKGPRKYGEIRTDKEGNFTLSGIEPGTYEITAEKYGFKRTIVQGIEIVAGITFKHVYGMEHGYASDDGTPGEPGYDPCKHEDRKPKFFMRVP